MVSDSLLKMQRKFLFTFILFSVASVLSETTDYCELPSCPNRSHTACKFLGSIPARRCGNGNRLGLTKAEKKTILQEHRKLRQFAHLSRQRQLSRRGIRLPYNIPNIHWDDELAETAQTWANQCQNRIDQCRNDPRFEVDQRMAIRELVDGTLQPSFASIIENWYFNDPRIEDDSTLLNATTIIRSLWESAYQIGCGELESYYRPSQTTYFVCNYAPLDYPVPFDRNYY